jgi:hypothetical protein
MHMQSTHGHEWYKAIRYEHDGTDIEDTHVWRTTLGDTTLGDMLGLDADLRYKSDPDGWHGHCDFCNTKSAITDEDMPEHIANHLRSIAFMSLRGLDIGQDSMEKTVNYQGRTISTDSSLRTTDFTNLPDFSSQASSEWSEANHSSVSILNAPAHTSTQHDSKEASLASPTLKEHVSHYVGETPVPRQLQDYVVGPVLSFSELADRRQRVSRGITTDLPVPDDINPPPEQNINQEPTKLVTSASEHEAPDFTPGLGWPPSRTLTLLEMENARRLHVRNSDIEGWMDRLVSAEDAVGSQLEEI